MILKRKDTHGKIRYGGGPYYNKALKRWLTYDRNGKTVYWSRVVMEDKIGRPPQRGEVVHHLNNDSADDRPENLQLLASHRDHVRLHLEQGDINMSGLRPGPPRRELTERQKRIYDLAKQGLSAPEIAPLAGVSASYVYDAIGFIRKKGFEIEVARKPKHDPFAKLRAENAKLREALEYYADGDRFPGSDNEVARAALKKDKS